MKESLWTIFDLLINIFQAFMAVFFAYSYLGDKHSKNFICFTNCITILIFALTVKILNESMVFEGLFAFIYILILFIYSLVELNGKMGQKIFSSVYPMVIMLICSVGISNLITVLSGGNQTDLSQEISLTRFTTIVIIQLCIFYLIYVSLKILHKEAFTLKSVEWILISVIFIISIFISAFLNFFALKGLSRLEKIYIVIIFIGIVAINILSFYFIIGLGKKNKATYENEILKLKEEHNKNFLSSAKHEYQMLKELRHDSKENFSILYEYIRSGKTDEALIYITKVIGEFTSKEIFIKTDNQVFDAIINSKFTIAKSLGIECTCICSANFEGLDEYDMVRLLSNMIENAITASKSVNKPKIELSVKEEGTKYIFLLKNKIDKSILSENPKLQTTKNDKKNHGLGISILKNISLKYNGRCDFYEENDFFCCFVIINSK